MHVYYSIPLFQKVEQSGGALSKFEIHLVLRCRRSPDLAPAAKNVPGEIAGKSRELTEADTILQPNPQLLVSRKQSDAATTEE